MEINELLYPLSRTLFLETSPCPVKYALSKMNLCENILRLPLVSINNDTKLQIDKILKEMKLIN